MKRSIALVVFTALFGSLANQSQALERVIQHLQAREYKEAAAIDADAEDESYAAYLKATAHFLAKDYSAAEQVAVGELETHPESVWQYKVRFLLARALIEQAKHKEAEAIYAAQAERIFSTDRKQGLAARLIEFADKLSRVPDPSELDALPPDYAKALDLYKQVLAMEITRELRDEIQFKLGGTHSKLGQHAEAINAFRAYLDEFDPTWSGPVGSDARKRGHLKENPEPAGKYRLDARGELIAAQNNAGDHGSSRQNALDLLVLAEKERPDDEVFSATIRMAHAWSYDRTGPYEKQIEIRRDFLKHHPSHMESILVSSVGVSRWIAVVYESNGRPDDAVLAYQDFLTGKNYKFVADEKATTPDAKTGISPAEQVELWKQEAAHKIGQIRFNQQRYEDAIQLWKNYVARYPNGAQWAASQSGIVNAEFQMAVGAVAADDEKLARERFDAFLKKYPLDGRARQILFTLGQMHMAAAEKMEAEDKAGAAVEKRYALAIEEWSRLISKYPGTEETSLALYNTGIIYSEKLDKLEEGLAAFKRLNWGSWAAPAQGRVVLLSEKSLGVASERTFRTNEEPEIAVTTRNIDKLKVSLYPLNLESYFRKTHQLGRVDHLDIDLIQPEKTWEVKFEDYAKYREMMHKIPVPTDGKGAFAGIVKVEGGEWSATTLVLRSDIELVMKSSRRELLVYAEDRRQGKPAAGAELLISDGSRIIGTGVTAEDGVYRAQLDELREGDSVRVFASTDGGVATNLLQIGSLNFSTGLTARGYIYTDKPAYRPGERVAVRGILRDVTGGSYAIPEKTDWEVRVSDPAGRMVYSSEVKLDRFGAFDASMLLPRGAQLGAYSIQAIEPKAGTTWTGSFQVAEFKLDRIRLEMDFPQRVYFRGEKIEATINATYYWGSPAADQIVQYNLPDGRQRSGKTDAEGKLTFELDTTGFQPGQALGFSATIPSFNITSNDSVFLAQLGFGIRVKPAQPLALSGEPFEVEINTTGADGEPVGKELTLTVLRREAANSNRTLEAVPWLNHAPPAAAEVTLEEHKVSTDPETGKGSITLKLEKGGTYTLRASGQDRFDQSVIGASRVAISDDEDANRLRFFADKSTYEVGAKIPLRLHSRVDAKLALLTFEGEEILSHKVVELKKGFNPVDALVENVHFPNFRVSVALIDGEGVLRAATKRFKVRRELKIVIEPAKETFAPGEEGEVKVTVTDQLGKPIEAAVSLALVNEALYAVRADGTPKIVPFFQSGAERYTEFLLISTAGHSYTALSRRLIRKEANTEFEYVVTGNGIEQYNFILNQELANNPGNTALFANCTAVHFSVFNNTRAQGFAPQALQQGQTVTQRGFQPRIASGQPIPVEFLQMNQKFAQDSDFKELGGVLLGGGGGGGFDVLPQTDNAPNDQDGDGVAAAKPAIEAFFARVPASGENRKAIPGQPHHDVAHASAWISPVVTDKDGTATVNITFPDTASQWRFTARGASVETLVGEATAQVVTRKDFFADLRLPGELQEGDTMPLMATVYNFGDYEGEVELKLRIEGGREVFETSTTASVKKGGTAEALFDEYTVPFSNAVRITLTAKAGDLEDELQRQVLVRPWGIEYASHAGGVTTDIADAVLELPGGQNYTGRKLTITLSPSLEQAIIDLAMARAANLTPLDARRVSSLIWPEPQSPPSALLAAASALNYARERKAPQDEIDALSKRTADLVASLVATQDKNGLWAINAAHHTGNYVSSATAYWALVLADKAGIKVHPATISQAAASLRSRIAKLSATDTEGRAIVTHALSIGGNADFSVANRLYRERANLSETALAYLSAAFVHMGRDGFARELLGLLAKKAQNADAGGRPQKFWVGGSANALIRDRAETTAMVLWCYSRLDRASGTAAGAAEFLVTEAARLRSTRSLGVVVTALAEYYKAGERNADDFEIDIVVNDKTVHSTKSGQLRGTEHFVLMPDTINAGANRVRVQVKGRGRVRYAATLSGFSPDMKDPGSFDTPYFGNRNYYHDRRSYRDVPLNAASTSPVKRLELGQRFRTSSSIHNRRNTSDYLVAEEHIPAGTLLVKDSLSGNFTRFEQRGNKLVLYFKPGTVSGFSYELVAHAPGKYRMLPGVLRDATDRGRMRLGKPGALEILPPDAESDDPYVINHSERFELAGKFFADGRHDEALEHLDALYNNADHRRLYEKDLARMLLWIHTAREKLDGPRLVEVFEVLRERHPEQIIPFDKILVVGRAYREIGEFERAWLVFRAAVHSSFLNDSRISAVLEDQGQYLGSVKFQEDLWLEYPDSAEVTTSLFALSQSLFQKAPEAKAIAARERRIREAAPVPATEDEEAHAAPAEREEPEKIAMLQHSVRLLERFLTLYPDDPLADDAAFSEVNAFFALKDYGKVVARAELGAARHPKSGFKSSFEYMAALGHFWQRHYEDALKSALAVAEGESKDRDYARYITAQIFHATGNPVDAMGWYEKVKSLYPDAGEAIAYFEEKKISVPEVTTVSPGDAVELELAYRNIREAQLQVYEVDLLKLYLREKNLADIAKIDLAGIDPAAELRVPLGEGKDFADRDKKVALELEKEGAYLVICRGDDLFTSGLVLISPLKLEIQEDPAGSVRVNVRDTTAKAAFVPEVLVKVVGTANKVFMSGHTDLRGIFEADGINGTATVLAKSGERQYAFYRGERSIGAAPAPAPAANAQPQAQRQQTEQAEQSKGFQGKKQLDQGDYLLNINEDNREVQDANWGAWDRLRRGSKAGVEAQHTQ